MPRAPGRAERHHVSSCPPECRVLRQCRTLASRRETRQSPTRARVGLQPAQEAQDAVDGGGRVDTHRRPRARGRPLLRARCRRSRPPTGGAVRSARAVRRGRQAARADRAARSVRPAPPSSVRLRGPVRARPRGADRAPSVRAASRRSRRAGPRWCPCSRGPWPRRPDPARSCAPRAAAVPGAEPARPLRP